MIGASRLILGLGLALALLPTQALAWTKIGSIGACGTDGATTAAFNALGADFIDIYYTYYYAINTPTPSDSLSNSYTTRTARQGMANQASRHAYVYAPAITSSMTFSLSGSTTYSCLIATAWSGAGSSPFDQETGNTNGSAESLQPTATLTPGFDGELVLCGWQVNFNTDFDTAFAIDSGFTVELALNSAPSTNYATGVGYQIQTTATGVQPRGSWTTPEASSVACESYKGASGGGGGAIRRRLGLVGVGR